MDYRDSIKNMQKLNDAYNTVRSATEGYEIITKSSQPLVQMPPIPELTCSITSAIDAMSQTFNHITALESSMEQASRLAELGRPLVEINASQSSIINLINKMSPILTDVQSMSTTVRGLVDTSTNTHLYEMINGIETIVSTIKNINYQKVFDKISFLNETFETIAQNMVSSVKWVNQINFDSILNSLVQTDTLEKTIWEYKRAVGVESVASSKEITELHNDLQDIAGDNKNWQQRLAEKAGKWKEKNPIIYAVIVQILLPLLLSILASFIYAKVTTPKAAIKDKPSATGNIVYNISINQDVTIIDDTRYYYMVKYYNEETDEKGTGWISKRSIKINDSNIFNEQ